MNFRRVIVLLGVCGVLGTLPARSAVQQASQSAADAAKKAKEQQKQAQKPKVWTNDNLPTAPTVSVVGQAPQEAAEARAAGAEAARPAPLGNDKELSSERDRVAAELAQAKKDLSDVTTDLDLAQRTYKLDSNQYYSAPDYADDLQGQARLNNDKDQVSTKQQAVDTAQKKVDELQKRLDALNAKLKSTPDSSQPKG